MLVFVPPPCLPTDCKAATNRALYVIVLTRLYVLVRIDFVAKIGVIWHTDSR